MAITKIIGSIHAPSKGGKYQVLKNTIDYILNPAKTEQGKYTGAINCLVDNALSEMKRWNPGGDQGPGILESFDSGCVRAPSSGAAFGC